ncbi:MAG TPA: hypothetical protein VN641_05965, partial [Urbifossiella sp.]|nr:hypothetical protein [Urbifossiella sp.]
MFRPLPSPASRPARRGTILIVVLALLALFAVIALFFVFFADAEATNARIMREAESYNGNDAAALDQSAIDAANEALAQMLFDVPNFAVNGQISGLRGHSLMASMYTRLPGQSPPFAGVGTFHEPSPVSNDRAKWIDFAAFAYVGAGGTPFFLDPEWSGSRNPTQGPTWWSAGPN